MPLPIAEAWGSSAHVVLSAGNAATFLGSPTEAARERGIRVHMLEPGQDARLAALTAVEEGAESLAVAGDGTRAAVAGVVLERGFAFAVVRHLWAVSSLLRSL